MKLKNLAAMLLCSATLPAFSGNIELAGGTNLVIGTTTVSTNGAALYAGRYDPGNTLTITNGGTVAATTGFIGQNSDNNTILVIGTNSSLRLEESLTVGNGKDNTLALENAGWVSIGSTNGMAGAITIGNTNSTAKLSIENSSTASAELLYVGTQTNESGSVALSGTGTELNISSNAYLGTVGSNNTITVSSGASLVVSNRLEVGSATGSNNVLNINSGGKVVVVNEAEVLNPGDNAININNGGQLTYTGDADLDGAAAEGLIFKSGSTLELGGELLSDKGLDTGVSVILNGNLNTNLVSTWNTGTDEMWVGNTNDNNRFTLKGGATATAGGNTAHIGENSNNNAVNVSGTGSVFTVKGQLIAGMKGDRNKLSIAEGGQATIATDLRVGFAAGADNNEISVSGSNSTLSVGGKAIIGESGSANRFNLTDGQVAVADDFVLGSGGANNRYTQTGGTNTISGAFVIGETGDASGRTGRVDDNRVETTGNLAMVGKDAALNIQSLTVGKEGSGSILTIRDGGVVNVGGGVVIGEGVKDNYIYLQRDAGTRFNVADDLVVGKEGGSNRFAVYGGTANIGGNLYLGAGTNEHEFKNFIHVETTNAVINVANALHIGASNSVNTLDLVGGATVTAQELLVGAYEGVSNNAVTVTGEGSRLSVTNNLTIGSDTGTNNTLTVKNGGTLFVGGTIAEVGGSNNVLTIDNNGTLQTLDWDFASISSNIFLNTGATLEAGGTLSGTNMVEGGIEFALNGTNALWNTGTNMLYVGNETDNNTLSLTNGAHAATSTNLYIGHASRDNTATIAGAGSQLEIGGDLFVGTEADDSSYNTLEALDGAAVSVDGNASLFRAATLKIDSSSQVTVGGDYEQDGFSTLEVGISSNQVQPNLVVAGNAGFANSKDKEQFPMIKVFDDGIDESNVVNIVQAKTITVDGNAATTGSLYDNIQTNVLLGFNITVSNGVANSYIVLDDFITRSIGEAADLEGQLLGVADEINDMKNAGDSNAIEMVRIFQDDMTSGEINAAMNNYYGEKASSAPSHNVINMGIASVASKLTVRGDNTRARMAAEAVPAGAAGPHSEDQQLQGWIAGYGLKGTKDADGGFNGYDADLAGFVIGADLAISKNILVGLAGGSSSGSSDSDNGASGDTKTTYGALYASLGTHDWFLDGSMIYGSSSIDTTLGSTFDTTASYDAQNIAFYLGGGKEIAGKYLIVTPQASLLANYYQQDAYTEKSTTAVPRSVDSFDALYVQSSLGCDLGVYMGMGNMTLKPEVRAHWLHEFNASDESLPFSLAGGTGNYTMLLQAPEEDILKLGTGVSAKVTEFLELRADLDTRWGSGYSDYILSGSLRYQF